MRASIILYTVLIAQAMVAQEAWRSILRVDPEMTNGYFILDDAMCQQAGVENVEVDLLLHGLSLGGGSTTTVLQSISFSRTDGYGSLDLSMIPELAPGEIVSYHVEALDNNDIVVEEFDRTDGSFPRHEICRTTCNSNSYAWALVAMENNLQSNTIIEFVNATNSFGEYLYFYVENADWNDFIQQFAPTDFCLSGGDTWSEILSTWGQLEVVNGIDDVSGMPSYLGYIHGEQAGAGKAVRKAKGPWCNFYAVTDPLVGDDYCTDTEILIAHFNSDDGVLIQLSQNDLPSISCDAALLDGGGPGWNEWGAGGLGLCITWDHSNGTEDADGDGVVDPVGWVAQVVDCPITAPPFYQDGLADVSSIDIKPWSTATPGSLVHITIPNADDPRLVPVPRTVLPAGLYEYMVVMNDGIIWRKFQSYDHPITISASFASFTDVAVYPVPVSGTSFSVDFELLAPMDVHITVVNNQGTTYYTKNVVFDLPGRNKHVINMVNQWPSGLYHVLAQYPDGSSETIGITVQ